MTKGMDVFNIGQEQILYDLGKAKGIIKAKLDPKWIKQRQQGTATLSYIGGNTVIHLLNAAFGLQWSFEIVTEEIMETQPKPMWDGWGKQKKPVLNPDGTQRMEPQPPVAKVLGRLTVPGLGVKEQYGSKVLIGGASEQESAFKSATTDALKKCASLFGIGLELYGDEEYNFDGETQELSVQQAPVTPVQQTYTPPAKQEEVPVVQETPPVQQAPQQPVQQASNAPADPNAWDPADIQKLKDYKVMLQIVDNAHLDPYVREFLDNPEMTWVNITPQNIKAFNVFMSKKTESSIG